MSMKFCVCEGSNENCRYCYGAGWYLRQPPSSQTKRVSCHGTATINFGFKNKGGVANKYKARPYTQCPNCSVHLRVDRLSKHLKKIHATLSVTTQAKTILTKGKSISPHKAIILSTNEFRHESPQMIRKLDHTRLYAHSFRENGLYGSHPSHDSFDDESNP